MTLEWYDVPAADLNTRRLHDLLALRCAVFVVEQRCVYLDVDGRDLDQGTRHLGAEEGGELLAYARLLAPGDDGAAHIGRVVVAPAGRGRRLGHDLVDHAVAGCRRDWPEAGIALSAQSHLQNFYVGHGFEARGEVYDDEGVDHIDMVWPG